MSLLPLYVYGQGDLFAEYFNAIAAALGTTTYSTLIKLTVALAGVTALFSAILRRDLSQCLRWFGLYYFVFYILFIPKVNLEIIDRVNGNHPYAVDNVPLGLGVLASYTSVIGDALTRLIESNFSMPDDLYYGRTGMVMASRLITQVQHFQVSDSAFNEALQDYIHQCVFYDVLLHKYTVDDLMNTPHLWSFLKDHASPARAFLYRNQILTCQAGTSQFENEWTNVIDQVVTRFAPQLFPHETSIAAKQKLLSYLPISVNYLTQLSDSASTILQQSLMMNALEEGVIRFGATSNSPAALQSIALSKAQAQKRLTNQTLGEMAAYWLPLMKNAFEAIMYGSFLLVFLLMLFPFGMSILRNYVFTLLWLQAWAPLYAIIHLILSFYARTQSVAVSGAGLTWQSIPSLIQANQDIAGLAGYLSLSVPFLSAGLVKGMAGTFTQLAQYIGGVTQSAGSSAAAEVVSGNLSMGNTNFSNHSAFNTSANHWDTSARESGGHFSYQMASGSMASITPSGSRILDNHGALSNLGTSVNLANSMRSLYSQQSDNAYSAALSEAKAYSEATGATFRNMYDLSNQRGLTTTSGSGSTVSTQGSFNQAINNFHQLTDKFAHDNNLSLTDAGQLLASAYVQAQLGVGWKSDDSIPGKIGSLVTGAHVGTDLSFGGRFEGQYTSTHQHGNLYSKAAEFMKTSQFSATVDTALRSIQDKSFHTQNESGQRLVDGINSSWDRAKQARHEVVANYQKSQSYHEMASYAEENAVNINANYSQRLFEFIANQPGTQGQGKMGMSSVDAIARDPELARSYVNDFIRQEANQLFSGKQNNIGSPLSVKEAYASQKVQVPSSVTTLSQSFEDRKQMADTATAKQLSDPSFIDNTAVVQANNIYQSAVQSSNQDHSKQDHNDRQLQSTVEEKVKNG